MQSHEINWLYYSVVLHFILEKSQHVRVVTDITPPMMCGLGCVAFPNPMRTGRPNLLRDPFVPYDSCQLTALVIRPHQIRPDERRKKQTRFVSPRSQQDPDDDNTQHTLVSPSHMQPSAARGEASRSTDRHAEQSRGTHPRNEGSLNDRFGEGASQQQCVSLRKTDG